MKEIAVLVLFLLHHSLLLQAGHVCKDESYELGLSYCYKLFESKEPYNSARDICRLDGSELVKINSEAENSFINDSFAKFAPFWIGLNDIVLEGNFRWIDKEALGPNAYRAWVDGDASSTNADNFDCVQFNSEGLWEVQQGFCDSSQLSFLCKQSACNSSDGIICDEDIIPADTSLSGGIIAIIIVIPVVIVLIIIIVIVLIYLWKYENDLFNKYICCCVAGGSKASMNSMKQEIQRLQTELSQQKLNSSGRFQSPLNSSSRLQSPMSRQQSIVSVQQPMQPKPLPAFNRSLSSNKVLPMNLPSSTGQPIRPPALGRGLSGTLLVKPQLSAVSEENNASTKENKEEDNKES